LSQADTPITQNRSGWADNPTAGAIFQRRGGAKPGSRRRKRRNNEGTPPLLSQPSVAGTMGNTFFVILPRSPVGQRGVQPKAGARWDAGVGAFTGGGAAGRLI